MSRSLRSLAVTSSVAVMVVAGSAPVAAGDASAARFAGAPADTSTPATATSVPSGYKIVVTNELTVASGTQAFATVTCPGTRRGPRYPMAGGVQILSSSLGANVSSTYPGGTSWAAYVNNASGAPTTFSVWAVCARPKSGYTVVQSASLPYPAGV